MFEVIAVLVIFLTLFVVVGMHFKSNANIHDKHDRLLKQLGEEAIKLIKIRNSDTSGHFQAMGKMLDAMEIQVKRIESICAFEEEAEIVSFEKYKEKKDKKKASGE